MQLLGYHAEVDASADVRWLLSAQSPMGGLAKVPGDMPDVLHSYLGYVALSMHQHEEGAHEQTDYQIPLAPVNVALNLSYDSVAWLRSRLWSDVSRRSPPV